MLRIHSVLAVILLAAGTLVIASDDAQALGRRGHQPAAMATTLCVLPPCELLREPVTVCVPCCCTEAPTVCWKAGCLGRQIGTYCWPCCGHEVEVVVNRRGDVIKVR